MLPTLLKGYSLFCSHIAGLSFSIRMMSTYIDKDQKYLKQKLGLKYTGLTALEYAWIDGLFWKNFLQNTYNNPKRLNCFNYAHFHIYCKDEAIKMRQLLTKKTK